MATFSEKLSTLMRRRGLTTRAIGAAVDLDHSAIARWLKGTRPYQSSAAKLADFFQLPVEVLMDDARDLPPASAPGSQERLASEPIQAAAAQALNEEGVGPQGQKTFEAYLAEFRAMRTEAERLASGDATKAIELFENMLASWRLAHDAGAATTVATPAKPKKPRKKVPEYHHIIPPSALTPHSSKTGKPIPRAPARPAQSA